MPYALIWWLLLVIIFTWNARFVSSFCIVLLRKTALMEVLTGNLFSPYFFFLRKKNINHSDAFSFGSRSSLMQQMCVFTMLSLTSEFLRPCLCFKRKQMGKKTKHSHSLRVLSFFFFFLSKGSGYQTPGCLSLYGYYFLALSVPCTISLCYN